MKPGTAASGKGGILSPAGSGGEAWEKRNGKDFPNGSQVAEVEGLMQERQAEAQAEPKVSVAKQLAG